MKDLKNLQPLDYLGILWRRRWYAFVTFALISIGAAAYAWYVPDVYRSASSILVEPAPIAQDYVRPSIRSSPEEQIASIRAQVYSRSFLEQMIQDFRLFGYGQSENFSMERAFAMASRSIEITNTSRNTFSIGFSSTDPQVAQNFMLRTVEALIQSGNSSRRTRAVETDQFLEEQLHETERDIAAQEDKIKQFKTMHLGELPEQNASNLSAISKLKEQLAETENALQQARDRQKSLDLRLEEQQQLRIHAQNLGIPEISTWEPTLLNTSPIDERLKEKEEELAVLTARYTPNYPDVIRMRRELEDLKRKSELAQALESDVIPSGAAQEGADDGQTGILTVETDGMLDFEEAAIKLEAESIKSEIAKREEEKKQILSQINSYQARLNIAPEIEQQLAMLSREYDVLKRRYTNLEEQKYQAQLTANMETNRSKDTYRIIDQASLPERPLFPDRLQMVLLGLGAGIILGIGAAIGREMLDTTVCREEEVPAVLDLPVLVTISEIPRKEPKRLLKSGEMANSA